MPVVERVRPMADVTVALDAMGGDRAPAEIVAGALEAAADGVAVLLCGRAAELQQRARRRRAATPSVEMVDAPDVIDFHDEPAAAVRAKPGSSLVDRLPDGARGPGRRGAISAGSTGAMLAASLLTIGRIRACTGPGIAVVAARPRPALPC